MILTVLRLCSLMLNSCLSWSLALWDWGNFISKRLLNIAGAWGLKALIAICSLKKRTCHSLVLTHKRLISWLLLLVYDLYLCTWQNVAWVCWGILLFRTFGLAFKLLLIVDSSCFCYSFRRLLRYHREAHGVVRRRYVAWLCRDLLWTCKLLFLKLPKHHLVILFLQAD